MKDYVKVTSSYYLIWGKMEFQNKYGTRGLITVKHLRP